MMKETLTAAIGQIMACGADQTASLPARVAFCVTAFKRDFQVKVALPIQCLFLLPSRGV